MLWVNLIMDTMAALSLATEPPAHDVLTRQPYRKDAPICTEVMWRNIFGHGIYQIIVLVVILFTAESSGLVHNYSSSCLKYNELNATICDEYNPFFTNVLYMDKIQKGWWSNQNLTAAQFNQQALSDLSCLETVWANPKDFNSTNPANCTTLFANGLGLVTLPQDVPINSMSQKLLHYTLVFQIFVFMQLFNQINARKIELGEINVFAGFFNNFLFIGVTIFTFIVQMSMVEVGGKAVKCWPLDQNQNLIALALGSVELIWGVIIKFIPLRFFQCVSLDDSPAEEDAKTSLASVLKKPSVMKNKTSK